MQPNYPQYQPVPQNSTLAIVSLIARPRERARHVDRSIDCGYEFA